jgi:Pyruvate/2-oxoacid:ferredoxin oxidoreductase delta subunit
MSQNEMRDTMVCPECYCADGWKTRWHKCVQRNEEFLECQHCHVWVPLVNVLEYNKENKGWINYD